MTKANKTTQADPKPAAKPPMPVPSDMDPTSPYGNQQRQLPQDSRADRDKPITDRDDLMQEPDAMKKPVKSDRDCCDVD